MSEAAAKLAAARTRLIIDRPFLGALVLRLPLVEAAWCRSAATDARNLYYNPAWIASLAPAQVQFALAHEALHCALGHFARRAHRVKRRWDLACDFAVNPLLVAEGLAPPPDAQVLDLYAGMAAEEIYPCLDDHLDNETLDEHLWDGDAGGRGGGGTDEAQGRGGGAPQRDDQAGGATPQQRDGSADGSSEGPPPPLGAAAREQLAEQWQRHLAAAAQRAREAGKLSGTMARLVDATLAAQVSWRALLAQHLNQVAREDYSYARPSRREGEMILPSLRSRAGEIHVAIDVSGSVGEAELADFIAELNALKGTAPMQLTLFACDRELAAEAPWRYAPWEALGLPRTFAGGGGTAFTPVFDWIERAGECPDVLVYFTDADGEFPPRPPDYPVLWLVKGNREVPWGRRIQLN